MLPVFVISLALLGLSGALIDSHRRTWREARQKADLPDRVRQFALALYRRRLQASGMIGVIGALIGIWPIVPHRPGPMSFYVAMMLAGCGWILLLALLDLLATRQHFRRLRDEQAAAHLRLAQEMRDALENFEMAGGENCERAPLRLEDSASRRG